MASNTSEGEERIIALLTQLVENNSNADSDRLTQTANSLSTAAITVSIVALVIGLLQALLQYASSNENHREKCNIGAIGRAAMLSGRSTWSWRHWRRMYTYPVLDFSVNRVFERLPGGKYDLERLEKTHKGTALPSLWPLVKNEPRQESVVLQWRERKRSKGGYEDSMTSAYDRYWPWQLYYDGQTTREAVYEDLSFIQRLRWHWYALFQSRNEKLNPRATWAQLLEALNIVDIEPLVTGRMDAECIASSVDVATQKISLQELGVLAYHLKMRTVDIDVAERKFLALGPSGSITTEDLPGFGKVLRFQSYGDSYLGFRSPLLRLDHVNQLFGQLCFGKQMGIFRDSPRTEASLPRNWRHVVVSFAVCCHILMNDVKLNFAYSRSVILLEAESWDKLDWLGNLPNWRKELRLYHTIWPAIVLAATTACLPGETIGFPSRMMLRPFLGFLSEWASEVRDRCRLPAEPISLRKRQSTDSTLLAYLQCEDLCAVDSDDLLEVYGLCELSSWAFWQIDTQTLKEAELRLCAKIYDDHHASYDFDSFFRSVPLTSEKAQETYRIFDEILRLLAKYEPDTWSAQIMSDQGPIPWPKRPQNILWTQILLLDLTIRELLNSYPPGSAPQDSVWCYNATIALLNSWDNPNAEWPLQHLDSSFIKIFNIDETDTENRDCMVRLSNLIQLRTLCFLAYLMVIPDSSDLCWALTQEKVVLPMI